MGLELLDRAALGAVVREELEDHVLELGGEAGAVDLLEVGLDLAGQEQVVEVLLLACFLEGEDALDDDEDDDADGEEVDLGAVVGLALLDLGCHVGHRAAVALELVDALVASETEVGNFEVQGIVDQNILELEVSVDTPKVVHVVDRVDQLLHEEAAGVLAHRAHGLAEVEEETAGHVLHHDEDEVGDDAARWLYDLAGVSEVNHSDDAGVVEVLENRNFVLHRQDGVFVASEELFLEDFNGDLLGAGVSDRSGQVDLAGVAFAEALDDLVLVVEDGVLLGVLR